jgi:hypothetical protein
VNDSFIGCLHGAGLGWALREGVVWALVAGNSDHLVVLLDLLQTYLETLIAREGDCCFDH